MARHGYDYEEEIGRSLEELYLEWGIWYYKKVDTYAYDWVKALCIEDPDIVKRGKGNKLELTIPKVPSDYIMHYQRDTVYIECKSTKDMLGWSPLIVQKHQIEASIRAEEQEIPYYFFVCDRSVPRHHKTYVIRGFKLRELIAWLKHEGRSKATWLKLESYADRVLKKQKHRLFDLSWLIEDEKSRRTVNATKKEKETRPRRGTGGK